MNNVKILLVTELMVEMPVRHCYYLRGLYEQNIEGIMLEPETTTTTAAAAKRKYATEPAVDENGTVRAKLKSNGKEIVVSAEHYRKYRANFA